MPDSHHQGEDGAAVAYAVGESSLGQVLVAQTRTGVCAILLGDDPGELTRELRRRFPDADLTAGDSAAEAVLKTVIRFVEEPCGGLDLPLDMRGTAFQRRVWAALREIPAGQTASYLEIAQRIGSPGSSRAVAGACAANSIAVVIPCHRVVRANGNLSGYRWGVGRKQALLEREAACAARR